MRQIITVSHVSMIYRQAHRSCDRELVEYRIGSGQLPLLVCIHEYEGTSMYGVAQLEHSDRGMVMEGVQKLEEQGYTRVGMDETDRRSRCLYTAEKAVAVVEQPYDIRRAWNGILVNDLTPKECAQAGQLLKRMAENA